MEEISLPKELIILKRKVYFMWSLSGEIFNPYEAISSGSAEKNNKNKKSKCFISILIQKLRA